MTLTIIDITSTALVFYRPFTPASILNDSTGKVDRLTWLKTWGGSDHEWEYTSQSIQSDWEIFTETEDLDTTGTFCFMAMAAASTGASAANFRVNANMSGYRRIPLFKK